MKIWTVFVAKNQLNRAVPTDSILPLTILVPLSCTCNLATARIALTDALMSAIT